MRADSLGVFARGFFHRAVAFGLGGIMSDFPIVPNTINGQPLTIYDLNQINPRPYWWEVRAQDILALVTDIQDGRERINHLRIRRCRTERDGFAERDVEQVFVFELDGSRKPIFQLYEDAGSGFEIVREGAIGLPDIPFATLFIGERHGGYRVKPPLLDLAHMQMELYRSLSRQDEILTYAGSPMLVAKGMTKDQAGAELKVGPKTLLFAPPLTDGAGADWHYIGPDAALVAEVAKNPATIIEDMRRLGLQPTLPRTAGITATSAAIDASQAHSAVQAWALLLQDCLNRALQFTAMWLKVEDVATVNVHTDFAGDYGDTTEAQVLGSAQQRGVISKQTEREELARRGILGPQFDEATEDERIAAEEANNPNTGEQMINPVTGLPINGPQLIAAR